MTATSIGNLADLARIAGVSTSTVSRALADSPLISEKTRTRIADLAREHGFQLNQVARNLRLGRTQAIAVVLPLGDESAQHVSDPFIMTLLGFLADALTERGYDLLLTRIVPSDDQWLDRLTISGRVDGVIVIGQSDQRAVLDRTAARYLPLVVWGEAGIGAPNGAMGAQHCAIGTDNREGGRLATAHLLAQGRRRIAFIGNPAAPEIGARHAGYLAALADANLYAEPALLLPLQLGSEAAFGLTRDFLATHPEIDGIVAASDVAAMGAIRALSEAGRAVPEAVAVVGYDDVPFAAHTTPPLTTIRQDLSKGADLLVTAPYERMAGHATPSEAFAPELVLRASA
ncbi:MAG TPA: substrate-binding domain-containing protein [Polymorphobacter sp.]|nr:substrate-binding domain-containing protein [Polymorphobacter sp.]